MGARITVFNRRRAGGEWIGDLEVHSSELTATDVGAEEVPRLVDELPLFALAAAGARGDSRLTGAAELRVKETDRIETVTNGLRALGAHIRARDDAFQGILRAAGKRRRVGHSAGARAQRQVIRCAAHQARAG